MNKSRVGRCARPFALPDADGALHRLDEFSGSWLLLVFHRHLGWLPCREHLSQLRQQQPALDALAVRVAVVTFEASPLARAYVEDTGVTWPLLIDADRSLYRAYGMERGRWWQIYSPATLWTYCKLLLRGRRLAASEGDLDQLGGDVLIDPEGIVRVHHVSADPADRPAVTDLLRPVRRAAP